MGRAGKSQELSRIASEIETCAECRRWGTGKAVPGEGNPDAEIMFIGEAPGKEEAKTGRPFVGRSGKYLRTLIKDIGFHEHEVYITSPVKYLPARGTPSRENVVHSRTHLLAQISVIDPKIIVLLGSIACFAVLGQSIPITQQHGRVLHREGRTYFITFHPAAALRFPERKIELEGDFQKLKALIRTELAGRP